MKNKLKQFYEILTFQLPEGYAMGYIFSYADTRQLDIYGEWEKVKRKRWFIFREPNFYYKKRMLMSVCRRKGLCK